jgi:hypothetical protein
MKPLEDKTIFEKEELYLVCEFDRPDIDAIWTKDELDVKYALGLDRFIKKVSGNVYELRIFEGKLDDSGSYSCCVKKTKTSCKVKVIERPAEVVKNLEDQEVVEKHKATFVCTLSKSRLKVDWYKDGKRLTENKRIEFTQEGKVYKLIIDHCELDDIGTYKIKYGDEAESSAQLFVLEAPIKIKSDLKDKEAMEEDEMAFLDCEMSKKIHSTDEIRWTFNGRELDLSSQKHYMDNENKVCKLVIKNIALEDEGVYAVQVNESRSSATLTVKGNFNNTESFVY